MLYSGAHLIRTSDHLRTRLDRLQVKTVDPVQNDPQKTSNTLDEETHGALLRFARFINKEKKQPRKKTPSQTKTAHPYIAVQDRLASQGDIGRTLDIYV